MPITAIYARSTPLPPYSPYSPSLPPFCLSVCAGVEAACDQEDNGVCYSCPDGYPNNVFSNGTCYCGKADGEQVTCILRDGGSAAAAVGMGVVSLIVAMMCA